MTGYKDVIHLTSTWSVIVDKLFFKIIPFKNPFKYYFNEAQQPFVTVFMEIKNRFYNLNDWSRNVKYNLQESFNFRYYNN